MKTFINLIIEMESKMNLKMWIDSENVPENVPENVMDMLNSAEEISFSDDNKIFVFDEGDVYELSLHELIDTLKL